MDANAVFTRARSRLVQDHPYLGFALSRLKPAGCTDSMHVSPAGTDGARFIIHPEWNPDDEAAADMLFHSLVHCLRGHIFEPKLTSLACDLDAALYIISVWPERCPFRDDPILRTAREHLRGAREPFAIQSRMHADDFFRRNHDALSSLLTVDDHRLWPDARVQESIRTSAGSEGLEGKWRREARRIGGGRQGSGTESDGQTLDIHLSGDAHYDFSSILRAYASLRENPKEDHDAIQPAWYHYGMEHLGMPLIEPMEYREERLISELIIVIDTSGSCARSLTQRFLECTRDILASLGLFTRRFRMHILQCDARVQRDDRIESMDEFRRYIRDLSVVGGGGTDFRPAFARADAYVASGELAHLKGILFFSDGQGIYPSAKPDYDVTFVFFKYRYDAIDAPSWVRTVVLDAPPPKGEEESS